MLLKRTWLTLLAMLILVICVAPASAQLQDNLGALTGTNAQGYLQPLAKGLSGTMNASIFRTGHIPKQGFNVSFGARLAGVNFDDEDRTYTPTDPPGFTSTGSVQAPTVIGDTRAVSQSGVGGTTLYHPGGFDIGEFAFGAPQLTVGSIMGTAATIRFLTIDIGDSDLGKFEMFGIGAQHSLTQYMEDAPFDAAFGIFWQSFKIDDKLVDTNSLHINVTGSKWINSWLQPYVGIGYDTFSMESEYTSNTSGTTKVEFDNENNFHGTLGGIAKLGIVGLFGEINLAARTGVAVGFDVGNF